MNKKFVWVLFLALVLQAVLFAQSPASGQDYWLDDEGRFHQVIRWTRTNALYYDVEVERRDDTGRWQPVETQRTEDTHLELILPPGAYRFRVHTYNVLERLVGTSDWTGVRVYEAKAPAADRPPAVEIPRGDVTFFVIISGEDLVEDAEMWLVSQKKGAQPVPPLSVEYSYNESWIRAEFSTEGISRGVYDLVITNPGGLSQTVEGLEIKFVRPQTAPAETMGPFDLSNTRSTSWGVLGTLGINSDLSGEYGEYKEGSSEVIYGAALNYTFFERYRNYGKFFWLPNSFFAEFSYTAKNKYVDIYHDLSGIYREAEQQAIAVDLGGLYKIRLGQAQRFLLNFGAGLGFGLNFYDATEDPGSSNEDISGMALFVYVTFRTGVSYRLSRGWSADLGIAFGGSEALIETGGLEGQGVKPSMINFTLGISRRKFY